MTKFTETKKTVLTVIDVDGPDGTYLSIKPTLYSKEVILVVGARFEYGLAANFTKKGLGELIEILKDIHSAMED